MRSYNKTDFFVPFLAVSFIGHFTVLGMSRLIPTPPQVAVVQAPNTVEVRIIEEPVMEPVQEIEIPVPEPEPPKIEEPIEEPIIEEPIKEEPIETLAVEQPIVEPVEKVQIPEPVEEIVEIKKPKKEIPKPKPVVQKVQPKKTIVSQESHGAIVEAQPMEYVNPSPKYPSKARQRGWQGIVYLKVRVEKNGLPSSVVVEKSSGYGILDKAAKRTVEKWRFMPAQAGSKKFSSSIVIPVKFKLTN